MSQTPASPPVPNPEEAARLVRRRLRIRPRWLGLVTFGIVVLALWVVWLQFHRPFMLMVKYGLLDGAVSWNLSAGTLRSGGTTELRLADRYLPGPFKARNAPKLDELASLPAVTSLDLTNSLLLSDDDLTVLSALSELRDLSLARREETRAWGQASPITDKTLGYLAGLTKLESLDLEGLDVTDAGMVNLARLDRLRFLSLKDTRITDAGLRHLLGLRRLESLDLEGTQVTGAGLDQLLQARPELIITHPDIRGTNNEEWTPSGTPTP